MIDPHSLITPTGRIAPDLFPEWDDACLASAVQAWITEAYDRPDVAGLGETRQDAAARAWAYHRAFDAAAVSMAANPATHSQTDAGSSGYSKDQRDAIRERADRYLTEFHTLTAQTAAIPSQWTGGQTVPHVFSW